MVSFDSIVETAGVSLPTIPEDEDDDEQRVPMMRAADVEQRTRTARTINRPPWERRPSTIPTSSIPYGVIRTPG